MAQADFIVKNGAVILNGLTATSTSTTTGALIVHGGIATSNTSTFGGALNIINTSSGALSVSGGGNFLGRLVVQGVDLLNYDQSVYYVSDAQGSDTNDGRRPQSAFKTIKHALSQAVEGNSVYIEPGTYWEQAPLTIPEGVSVIGRGLRDVFIRPTTATNTATLFLLNGGSTVKFLTVGGYFKPGYGFAIASGAQTDLRSAYLDKVTILTQGSNVTTADPYGYDSNDAGNGILGDGANLTTASIHPALLLNEVTLITPGATAIYMTNGIRMEALNVFTYFADKGIHAVSGTTGWGGQGRTRLRLVNTTGTFTVGHTLHYKSSTGTILASGVINEVTPNYIWLSGKASGFEEAQDRTGKAVNVYGDTVLSSFQRKFGTASVRFTSNGDLLEVINDTDLQYGVSAYTLDAWVHLTANNRKQYIFNKGTSGPTTFGVYIGSDNKVVGQHGTVLFTSTTALSTGTWYHVMMSRDLNNTNYLFVNGALETTATSTANVTNADNLNIGGLSGTPAESIRGYIDEIRVSSVARYTNTFTVATASYNSDVSTKLLLHGDGADGSISITDDGLGSQDVYSTTGTYTAAVVASAQQISLADYRQFGAELRCIGSAAVFGNYGCYADGEGVDLKLIAFNMGYVGSGKDLTDDPNLAIQANEVVTLNRAKVYFQTVDHLGDFRVGPEFRINQRTGNVDFGTANFRLGPLSSLTISDGVNTSVLQPTSIQVGQLTFSAGKIATISGNLTLDPAGSLTTIESDLQVNGGLNFTGQFLASSVENSTSTTTGAIVVSGGVGIAKDLFVGGNATVVGDLRVLGQTTVVATTSTAITDPVIDLGVGPNNTPLLLQDGYDRGLLLHYSTTSTLNQDYYTKSFLGMDGVSEELIFKTRVHVGTSTNIIPDFGSSGAWGNLRIGKISLEDTTTATSKTSGSLVSLGGAGFAKDVYADNFYETAGKLISTGTIGTYAVKSLTAGTDTAISTATGDVLVWNTSTLQTVTQRGSSTDVLVSFLNTTNSTGTTTGAVTIAGGLGVGGNIHAGNLFVNGSQVVTEGTIGALGVTALYAGTDTAVSTNTGLVTVWNTSTLQTVTDRGSTTSNIVNITNTTSANTSGQGALVVSGGIFAYGAVYSEGAKTLTTETDTLQIVTDRGFSTTNRIVFANTASANFINTESSVSIDGGIYVAKNAFFGDFVTVNKNLTGAITSSSALTVNGNGDLQTWYDPYAGYLDLKFVNTGTAGYFSLAPSNLRGLKLGPNNAITILDGSTGTSFVGINTSTPTAMLEVAGDIKAYNMFSNGSQVLTNATLGSYGVTSLTTTTGGGLHVSTTTGAIIIQSIDDLNSVAGRGNISTYPIIISSGVEAFDTGTGALIVYGGAAIQRSLHVGSTATLASLQVSGLSKFIDTTESIGTDSGAVVISGGLGVGKNLYGSALYDGGLRVVTSVTPTGGPGINIRDRVSLGTATSFTIDNTGVLAISGSQYIGVNTATGIVTITNLGVQRILAGTDTAITTQTGVVTIWNTSTLESITSRGSSSTYQIILTNIQDTNTSTDGALVVTGGVGVGKSLVVGGNAAVHGNLQVFGQTTYVDSTNTYIVDPVIELGSGPGNTVLSVNDGYDRGLVLNYNPSLTTNTGTDNHAFLGMDNDSQMLVYKTDIYPGGITQFSPSFSNTGTWGRAKFGSLILANGTSATNTTSGALQIIGGAGIGGTVYIGERLFVNGAEVLTNQTGGPGSYVSVLYAGTDTAVNTNTGVVTVFSTATLDSISSRNSTVTNKITFANTSNSTSTTTGNSIVVQGGVGVGGDVYVAGNVYSQGGTPLYTPRVTVSLTPPNTATNRIGDFWIDPSIGVEYQWIKDGSNYYWIQMFGSL